MTDTFRSDTPESVLFVLPELTDFSLDFYHTSDIVLALDAKLGWVLAQYVFSQVFEDDMWYWKAVAPGMQKCECDSCELNITYWMPLPDTKEFT